MLEKHLGEDKLQVMHLGVVGSPGFKIQLKLPVHADVNLSVPKKLLSCRLNLYDHTRM